MKRWLHGVDMGGMEEQDYKSVLQELIRKRHKKPPEYEIMSETGPEHDKLFAIRVLIGHKVLGMGSGKNKKSPAGSRQERHRLSRKPRSIVGSGAGGRWSTFPLPSYLLSTTYYLLFNTCRPRTPTIL